MRKADFLLMLHTATRLTLMLCILFREEFSLFLLIQESCMFLAQISTLLTPSFGNHLFDKYDIVILLHSKSRKKGHKKLVHK